MLAGDDDSSSTCSSSGPWGESELTPADVDRIFQALRVLRESGDSIEKPFKSRRATSKAKGDVARERGDIEDWEEQFTPYVFCKGVSVAAYNAYLDSAEGRGEKALGHLMELDADGNLLLVDWPTPQHESITQAFSFAFVSALGDAGAIAGRGRFTATRQGVPSKEADATFGPRANTPERGPPPQGVSLSHWVTLAVEVGWFQSWSSLLRAAQWWAAYLGVQYILCIKVLGPYEVCSYRLYDLSLPREPDNLPEPAEGDFPVEKGDPVYVTFNAHRLLAIPEDGPLPQGVKQQVTVDLRDVMVEAKDTAPCDD